MTNLDGHIVAMERNLIKRQRDLKQVPIKQVAPAILSKDGRVLVPRPAPRQKLEGFRASSGEKFEPDERIEDRIVGRLAEELGVAAVAA